MAPVNGEDENHSDLMHAKTSRRAKTAIAQTNPPQAKWQRGQEELLRYLEDTMDAMDTMDREIDVVTKSNLSGACNSGTAIGFRWTCWVWVRADRTRVRTRLAALVWIAD